MLPAIFVAARRGLLHTSATSLRRLPSCNKGAMVSTLELPMPLMDNSTHEIETVLADPGD